MYGAIGGGRGSFSSCVPPVIQELHAEKTSSVEIPGAFVTNKLAILLTLENGFEPHGSTYLRIFFFHRSQ